MGKEIQLTIQPSCVILNNNSGKGTNANKSNWAPAPTPKILA